MNNKNLIYEKVHLVDDNPIVNMVHEQIIKRSGIAKQINKFTNPLKALEVLEMDLMDPNHNILVLLDINMPEMSGFEFLDMASKFMDYRNNFELIMVTSSIDPKDMVKATGHHLVSRYVTKPLTLTQIFDFVRTPSLNSA